MGYVELPNLPQGIVTAVILSPQYDGVISDLRERGIALILTEKCEDVQDPVSFHADILCHHLGGNNIVVYPYSYSLDNSLSALGMNVMASTVRLSSQYPHDVALNAVRIGSKLVCNKKYTDRAILSGCTYESVLDVAQGYAKCSTLIVDENSVITADSSIAGVCRGAGMDVLLISQGGVRLDGYDYGFIGGAAVKLSRNEIYFTGRLASHRDGGAILSFLQKRRMRAIEGSYDSLVDIGSILPILER